MMKYKVTLNNRVYEVEVEEGSAMLVDEYELAAPAAPAAPVTQAAAAPAVSAAPAASSSSLAAGDVVRSPMPGNVLKINVSQGQKVAEGEVLLVLEAMKMENDVVSPKAGTVAQIVVASGAVVETDAPLVVIA